MSYETRLAPRAYGDAQDGAAQKGSVRAARERMQAAQMRSQLPDTSKIIGLPQRPNQLVSQYTTNRNDGLQPRTPTDRRDDEGMPSPTPPWPLPNDASPSIPPRSPNRLRPPQATIRPVSDDFPIQQPSPGPSPPLSPDYLQPPSFNFRLSNKSDDMYSPSSRPFSGASEASSLGSIPDFPVPQPPMPAVQPLPRRVPSLGPPPSSRRGPSSYYTQMSYVSPIVEESETRSDTLRSRHGSFASSNVFPMNSDDFYRRDYPQSDDDETITSDRGTMSPGSDHDDQSGLVKDSPTLVRQASLGRRTKPSLMTIKSVDNINEKTGNQKRAMASGGASAAGIGGTFAMRDAAQGSPLRSSILSSGTGLFDPSSSSSSDSLNTYRNTKSTSPSYTGAESPIFPFQPGQRSNTLADRVGFKRPPKLNMDTVRDAEARGSLTSLPDLIRRATRLAANLDRGKTASRLGLDFWEAGAPEQKGVRKSQNSLTDMLAAFPPPGQETPQRSGTPAGGNVMAEWPSSGAALRSAGANPGYGNEKSPKQRQRRRCCGLPLWTFITLLIVLLFIIAAAVVIPIVLVVIPNQNKSTSAAQDNQGNGNAPTAPAPTSGPGSGSSVCQNGGVAIKNADSSTTCVCINGFTGSTCNTNDSTGCTTTSIMGTAKNATVGSGIPRIVQSSIDDFNVPLDATRILALFSSLSLSCAAENALITFNGLTSRSVPSMDQSINMGSSLSTRSLPVLHIPHPARQISARQDVTPISSNTTAVDFARVGVLFALQQDGKLNTAATAQENVQDFLTSNRNGNSNTNTVDLGPFTMDLVNLTIKFDNGTTIGPKS